LPLAAYAELHEGMLNLRALVAAPDASKVVRAQLSGSAAEPERLGEAIAAELRRGGAERILASL
jgi:hydroxymethylbilane synthase